MKKILLPLLIVLLLLPIVHASNGHITLLTVAESDDGFVGGTADIFLEVKPGKGRVFMDSFPLTKVDTQISTRFAKDVACNFLDKDCSKYDLFYTIRSGGPIVGGPSAGAAITILTISVLDNVELDKQTVITGTINSGGIIGAVGGIREKSQAALDKGFDKVLIPKWSILNGNETNISYANELEVEGIEIVTVSTIEEALEEFTGKKYVKEPTEINIPEKYQDIMREVSVRLCERYDEISKNINETNTSKSQREKAKTAIESNDYYSAASFCFSANTQARTIEYQNTSNESLKIKRSEIELTTKRMLENLDKINLTTLSDLETYMIVKERLFETKLLLEENESTVLENLGYINERMYSAVAWSAFFDYNEGDVTIDDNHLEQACLSKIAEAEERESYITLLFGEFIERESEIDEVKDIYASKDYAFCIFKAAKIKSEANAILATSAVSFEKLPELVDDQLILAQKQINKQGNNFPILGYSYYNYANTLKETEPILAVIFSEYASDLSNLEMYFPRHKSNTINFDMDQIGNLLIGFGVGVILTIIVLVILPKKKDKPRETSRKQNPPGKKR